MLLPWDYDTVQRDRWENIQLPRSRVLASAEEAACKNGYGRCYLPTKLSLPTELASATEQLSERHIIGLKEVPVSHGYYAWAFLDKRSQDRYLMWFYDINPKDYV